MHVRYDWYRVISCQLCYSINNLLARMRNVRRGGAKYVLSTIGGYLQFEGAK